jgi:glycosyltransferase involved in cell wall biosynthesis
MLRGLGHKVYSFFPCMIGSFGDNDAVIEIKAEGLDGAFGFRDKKFLKKTLHPSLPFYCGRNCFNKEELDNLTGFISDKKIDFIFIESTFTGEVYYSIKKLLHEKNIAHVFFSHNIDYRDFFNLFKDTPKFFWKMYYLWEAFKLYRYERRLYKEFRLIYSVSYDETPAIKKIVPDTEVIWVPPIIPYKDTTLSAPQKEILETLNKSSAGKKVILFTGIMDKSSNIRAARWFALQVMPHLLKSLPEAEFWIVGKNPGDQVLSLQRGHVKVYANVPEINPYFHRADLVVVPIFNNAGVKIKLIEALHFGKPVVSTSPGLYGSGLHDIVPKADTPHDFADSCMKVLTGVTDIKSMFAGFEEIYDNRKIIDAMNKKISGLKK